jgi:hypothetical protein
MGVYVSFKIIMGVYVSFLTPLIMTPLITIFLSDYFVGIRQNLTHWLNIDNYSFSRLASLRPSPTEIPTMDAIGNGSAKVLIKDARVSLDVSHEVPRFF